MTRWTPTRALRTAILAVLQFAILMFPLATPAFSASSPEAVQTVAYAATNHTHGHSHDDDVSTHNGAKGQHYSDHSHDVPSMAAVIIPASPFRPRAWERAYGCESIQVLRLKIERPPRLPAVA